MTQLSTAKALYVGGQPVTAVYAGDTKVWPPKPSFDPKAIPGLALWLDPASGIGITWPDKSGLGNNPTIVGSPAPVVVTEPTANNQMVVRFNLNEGRIRIANWSIGMNFTALYVTRTRTSNYGRGLGAIYPGSMGSNMLIGTHTYGLDVMYDDGWLSGYAGWPSTFPLPWRVYSADAQTAGPERFWVNGVLKGTKAAPSRGFGNTLAISGYDATLTPESCDIDVGEVFIYDHPLTDAERQSVEGYLTTKYGVV
jgi:hypothetical protein